MGVDIDLAASQEYFNRTMSGDNVSIEATLQRKGGSMVLTEISSKEVTLAGIRCIHTAARDITSRNEAEAALRRSEAKYRELVKNSNNMIVRFDTQSRVTFFNEYAQEFLGRLWKGTSVIQFPRNNYIF